MVTTPEYDEKILIFECCGREMPVAIVAGIEMSRESLFRQIAVNVARAFTYVMLHCTWFLDGRSPGARSR